MIYDRKAIKLVQAVIDEQDIVSIAILEICEEYKQIVDVIVCDDLLVIALGSNTLVNVQLEDGVIDHIVERWSTNGHLRNMIYDENKLFLANDSNITVYSSSKR